MDTIPKLIIKGQEIPWPPVTILIPVYGGGRYLRETMESIWQNCYPNFEVIFVDDGSRDDSKKICRQFTEKDHRVRFYGFDRNRGMDRVLNFGIKQAHGKYIARLNQDDLIKPRRLERQVRFLEKHPDHVAVGGQIILFTDKKKVFDRIYFPLTDQEIRAKWLIFSPFSDPAATYRKQAFLKTRGYSQGFWPVDDVHMWYQLGKIGKLANLPQVVTKVRWHGECGSIRFHRLQMQKIWEVHCWAAKNISLPPFWVWFFWVGQRLAGVFLPAEFNWYVYRQLKKLTISREAIWAQLKARRLASVKLPASR